MSRPSDVTQYTIRSLFSQARQSRGDNGYAELRMSLKGGTLVD
jgi:hypothetical protein